MFRTIILVLCLVFIFPINSLADTPAKVKAAYIKNGNLWSLINGEKKQITTTGRVFASPKWSYDGKWLLYQMEAASDLQKTELQAEIWAYHVETGEKKKIFRDGIAPSWAPNKKMVAFKDGGILDISTFEGFYNIATGVSDYTWLPDGSGFLLSTSGHLQPDGWTSAILYTKKLKKNFKDIIFFGGVDHFFTLPREIGDGERKIIAVYADGLTFSPSGKWISFIVSPTASWSMDSNMVCVISSDGKNFEVLDEIILEIGSPKWAPTSDTIAYIAGGGRIVFRFKNKDLKVREMPASGTLTPTKYADLDFDWVTDRMLVSSRVEEREWSNDFSKHPLPSLYSIDLAKNMQNKITIPPKGFGDYHPRYVGAIDKILWFRGKSIIDQDKTLWQANPDGSEAVEWMKDVEEIVFYE
ncbi:TolB family protein [Pseudoneobacillus sp. C159]